MVDSSKVISFRLSESELAQLKEKAKKGESLNQVAQRLLRHLLMGEMTNLIPDTLTELVSAVELSIDSKIADPMQLLNQKLDAVLSGIAGARICFFTD
ncbi:hypothetical protein NIES4071_108170 (plasmid) [Calothrix sp. NIES-4071]|nr:hypothetical protein NIES4071_108170 [Calothrix sp. NIES-4071]BAZ64857.1 hypothetical protein NIES4105_105900 [Calothrix sp. NIES-4105]